MQLPGLAAGPVKAKVDSGARTSALHASNLELEERDGVTWVRFDLGHRTGLAGAGPVIERPVKEFRQVRSSTGQLERRPLIRTPLLLGADRFLIDVTLTSRNDLGFPMLLGRSAIRRRFLLDAGRSFVLPVPDATGPTRSGDSADRTRPASGRSDR